MKILVIYNTHGDEVRMSKRISFDTLIGNPEAYSKNVRYIESDLNRSFNGKSETLEEKRAQYLIPIIQSYDLVLDIHSTVTGIVDACIVVGDTKVEQEYARYIGAKNYIIMPEMKHSLIAHAKNGIAIELGKNDDIDLYEEALDRVSKKEKGRAPNKYICIGGEEKPEGYTTHLKNYENVSKGQIIASKPHHVRVASESFTTFLWGNDQYEDIFGWKLVKARS